MNPQYYYLAKSQIHPDKISVLVMIRTRSTCRLKQAPTHNIIWSGSYYYYK